MKDFGSETVGMLVAEQPLRASVFDRFGIDYCCGGKQSLVVACEHGGIAPDTVIASLIASDAEVELDQGGENWLNASLTELVDHIQQTHHAYLKGELPRLELLAKKVARVHGVREPRLLKVESVFSALSTEILEHTAKEELIVFPFMRSLEHGAGKAKVPLAAVESAVDCLESEHNEAGSALMQLRELTDEYTPPENACASWQALLAGLAHLDKDLRVHVHKENSILFPLAIKTKALTSV